MSTQTVSEPMFTDGDSPRARRTDNINSHLAADRSQKTIKGVRAHVLRLIFQEGALTGTELNELYKVRWERYGWHRASWDSPRKRAGELAADGLLKDTGAVHGEAEYVLTIAGLEQVA